MEATFCFVDVAGFTALTEAHGAEAAADLVDQFSSLVGAALADGDRFVDCIGDAAFVVSPRPDDGVGFVVRLFRAAAAEPNFPALRAGLHHGEAVERGESFYGGAVNLAARAAAHAGGSQVIATRGVAQAAKRLGIAIASLGPIALRNMRDPVELFTLNILEQEHHQVLDPVCRMLVIRESAAGHLHHDGVEYWFCSLDCVRQFADHPSAFVGVR